MPQSAPFQVHPRLTQIALAIVPQGMIADQVLPRVPVPSEQFKYTQFATTDAFDVPETLIGRTGRANEVEITSSLVDGSTEDHGLEYPVPLKDVENARAYGAADPLGIATEKTVGFMDLAREQRVANLVTATANYSANLRATLSGTGQWSHTDSDPVAALQAAMESMLVRPNTLVLGRAVWTALRRHARVIAAVFPQGGNAASGGQASLQAVADLLEVERILVGETWVNAAKKGQTASFSRLWGKDAALLHLDRRLTDSMPVNPTWGFTATFGGRAAGTYDDPSRGVKGSVVVKVTEQMRELVAFPEAGYLFKAAVA